ncbi:hypothetical protein FGE12_04145 [Aggregicoccus sp. 17bor-14]|uniref:hypothetical protein n=1 Tax=Myxococcaceae TaxID=31 RepID=UPI00129D054C|nr:MULTISPECIES: hypothetical protein [Myxococcaceae]MBF5041566.1 hypothetical protein [Simulacricoccus sp. 17bor-14]MRI87351.1 hypothetical protein [Aggregicoccus sp. 17bor-14]
MSPREQLLRERLSRIPAPQVAPSPAVQEALADTERYLGSDAALRSLVQDPYWPKWHSPWWHMLLLLELGEAQRIPQRTLHAMSARLEAMPVKCFPIAPGELPPGMDLHRDTLCHCAVASIVQVLAAGGLDVDRALPWAKPWLLRYQMADGGLTCDNDAYRVSGECPSSMVGTVSPLEAMLLGDPAGWSAAQRAFVDRAAGFLVGRELRRGSATVHNAEERSREPLWLRVCFPRFYFYDVLRGARVLVRWAELRGAPLPLEAVEAVALHLCEAFPDGVVRPQRQAYEGTGTLAPDAAGTWTRQPASRFPLLEATSAIGEPSPWLTRHWTETRQGLLRLLDAGRLRARS